MTTKTVFELLLALIFMYAVLRSHWSKTLNRIDSLTGSTREHGHSAKSCLGYHVVYQFLNLKYLKRVFFFSLSLPDHMLVLFEISLPCNCKLSIPGLRCQYLILSFLLFSKNHMKLFFCFDNRNI